MDPNPIYLDHNATTPLLPEVVDAMLPYLREHFGNPSSRHVYGRRTHDAIEHSRCAVAALIGSHADEIIFTSGGTEANNLAIRGTAARNAGDSDSIAHRMSGSATAPCAATAAVSVDMGRSVGAGAGEEIVATSLIGDGPACQGSGVSRTSSSAANR